MHARFLGTVVATLLGGNASNAHESVPPTAVRDHGPCWRLAVDATESPWEDGLLAVLDWLCVFFNCPAAMSHGTPAFESEVAEFIEVAAHADVPQNKSAAEKEFALLQIETARLINAMHADLLPTHTSHCLDAALADLDLRVRAENTGKERAR